MSDYGKGDAPELRVDEDGREYWQYPSGMSKWKDTGHFRTPQTITPIQADPAGMLQRRNEKSRTIAREAIDAGAGLDPHLWGTGLGWFELVRHTTETFLKSGNLRGMAETLTKLATAAGYASREEDSPGRVVIENLNIAASGTLLEVVKMIEANKRQSIDGNIIEPPTGPSV
jgi:hypothetical protein